MGSKTGVSEKLFFGFLKRENKMKTPYAWTEDETRAALCAMSACERRAYRKILRMNETMLVPDSEDVRLGSLHARLLDEIG